MTRRGAGVSFIAVAALLYAAHYVAAAIFGSGVATWNADLFRAMLQYVGNGLTTFSMVMLVLGAVYLIWAEVGEWRSG